MADGNFTDEQLQVVELEAGTRALVAAPAGTGKTYVLAGRLAALVERDGLDPGDDVLVLSFSRAAVAELRRRVSGLGGDASYVGTSTFDSFSSRVLASEYPEGDWMSKSYDDRVDAAVKRITADPPPGMLRLVKHLLVDEIQDLVGCRAELVLALIDRIDCGITLFGDPAQAIYGHQARGDEMTTAEFFQLVRADPRFRIFTLTKDFRSTVSMKEDIARIGTALRSPSPEQQRIADAIRSVSLRVPLVELAAARRILTKPGTGSSGLLCRTNGEALRVSSRLFDLGVRHSLQRRGEDKVVGAWLARAVTNVPGTRLSAQGLRETLETAPAGALEDVARHMRLLDPARGDGFDLRRIANRIRSGDVPEEVNAGVATDVVVSTIHRAKGLEFDRVLLSAWESRGDDDPAEENRLRYVALTRAKRELYQLPKVDIAGLRVDPRTSRWIRRGFGRDRWRVREIEVVGTDSDATYPARSTVADERETQEYILTSVAPGDALLMVRVDDRRGGGARFVITHGDRTVGLTSPAFHDLLGAVFGDRGRTPSILKHLRVEMVDTVAGDANVGSRAGLGAHGLWARVRPIGLASVEFSSTTREET